MPSYKLSFTAGCAAPDDVCDILEREIQPDAVGYFETGDSQWQFDIYSAEQPDTDTISRILSNASVAPISDMACSQLGDEDWVSLSQSALHPVRAGRFLVHGSHDRLAVRQPNTIEIDAGNAFGTAHHATTVGCLLALDETIKSKSIATALDIGTGSGILAIALARADRQAKILATEIDPVAVAVAIENTILNGVARQVQVLLADGFQHRRLRSPALADVTMANILANPLKLLARDIVRATRRGGTIILSGILATQASSVMSSYCSRGCRVRKRIVIDNWATLVLERPNN